MYPPIPSPAMNTVRTVLIAKEDTPNTRESWRIQTISYISPEAPDKKNMRRMRGRIDFIKINQRANIKNQNYGVNFYVLTFQFIFVSSPLVV